jgi:hypothetical protein
LFVICRRRYHYGTDIVLQHIAQPRAHAGHVTRCGMMHGAQESQDAASGGFDLGKLAIVFDRDRHFSVRKSSNPNI